MIPLQPFDTFNQELESEVHPRQWTNPTPSGRYNLVVIGAGTAGLVTAAGAAALGARVALIERGLMGGDCLNVGCVPSKAIISSARLAASLCHADQFGTRPQGQASADHASVDFAAVMQRMRKLRAGISHHDSAARFRDLGVDVFFGNGKFVGTDTVEVEGQKLRFKKAVIATGSRATKLALPGIDDVGALTNESLFSLTELPRRFIVIGGGPVGTEMAQAFARLGSHVTQIEKSSGILHHDDRDAAAIVQTSLQRDGVQLIFNAEILRFQRRGSDKVVVVRQQESEREFIGDEVLLAVGRTPNVDTLGLDMAGIEADSHQGVTVNDRLQTSNPNVYAAGDVASKYKFTHAADFLARTVIRNALFKGRGKASSLMIPWVTYTSPELAHVGLTARDAAAQGIEIDTYTQPFAQVDRAILEDEIDGFARVHVKQGSDKIVGGSVVAAGAGDMICELSLAMTHGIGLKKIASTIHPYPTRAEAIRKLGDQYNRTRLTPVVKTLMSKWLAWTR